MEQPANSGRLLLALAAGVVAAFLILTFGDGGVVFLTGLICINIVVALAYNLLFSYIGLMSFGQAMFFATGAYACGLINLHLPQVPFLIAVALSGLAGMVLALVVGAVSLRRSEGVYFAVLTLAFSQVLYVAITKTAVLGRSDGLTGLHRPTILLPGLPLGAASEQGFYSLIVVLCASFCGFLWWIKHSRLGRAYRAIRDNPARAAFLGLDVHRYRLSAFVISGGVTSAVAALYGPWMQILSPDIAYWSQSTLPLLFTLLGGASTFWGPAVGTIAFTALQYSTRNIYGAADLTTGVLLLAVVIGIPGGICGIVSQLVYRNRRPASLVGAND